MSLSRRHSRVGLERGLWSRAPKDQRDLSRTDLLCYCNPASPPPGHLISEQAPDVSRLPDRGLGLATGHPAEVPLTHRPQWACAPTSLHFILSGSHGNTCMRIQCDPEAASAPCGSSVRVPARGDTGTGAWNGGRPCAHRCWEAARVKRSARA